MADARDLSVRVYDGKVFVVTSSNLEPGHIYEFDAANVVVQDDDLACAPAHAD